MTIAKVEPLTTTRALRGPFDYLLGERFADVGVGSLLLVPFGRQRLHGVVTGLAAMSDLAPERLAEPIAVLGEPLPEELVELGLWVGREYCSTASRGLELVLPPGSGASGGGVKARVELRAELTRMGREALVGGERLGPKQRSALERLATADGPVPVADDRDSLKRLEKRGLVSLSEAEVSRRPESVTVGAKRAQPVLTPAQAEALKRITAGLDGTGGELLLHGVTGSGKTEVYLTATEAALERGRGVIVLVPEIGLTPQTVSRFEARFGDRVAVLHSGLSVGERRDEWQRLRRGEARVCVGPRSAVFAPLEGLGLVIVDEEHDSSYKQESDPRYDARDVARRRAEAEGAMLVAGTATPRPESWERLERIILPERADGSPMPGIDVVDMRERDGREGHFHALTREALVRLVEAKGKAIVMVPRRGWSPFMDCRTCGHAWRCPNCDVSLVLHRAGDVMRCHHCGHSESVPERCPECGSVSIARHGAGSERVSELVAQIVSPLPVLRLDSDSAARKGAHARILAEFDRAESGVLIGTQMVAKGHDFEDVGLSVIIDADSSLRFPDFRAEERTFALVSQLAGRSGRGGEGRVIVQTMAPGAEAITRAAAHDAAGFLEGELERRRELSYPPFATLVRIEMAAKEARAAEVAARQTAARLRPVLPRDAMLLGPAPRFRLRDRERRQILVKAQRRSEVIGAVREAVDGAITAKAFRGVQLSVDVDPQ
ncbi:MAG TPA: primosomal protein N' [Solirubrobacterales bacterium]|nr:primosomal protein N' [Solirubrobacterales bacterium]